MDVDIVEGAITLCKDIYIMYQGTIGLALCLLPTLKGAQKILIQT